VESSPRGVSRERDREEGETKDRKRKRKRKKERFDGIGFFNAFRFDCLDVSLLLSTSQPRPPPFLPPPTTGVDTEITRAHLYHGLEAASTSGTSPLPPPPLALLSEGSELAADLSPLGGEHVVSKKRFSAFHATHLASLLRRLGVNHVVVAGVQTPNCIRATAFDALAEDFSVGSGLADCTASATEVVQQANLFDLRNAGIHTPTLAQWRASLGGGGLFSALFGR